MVDIETVRKFALAFEETEEQPHFERTSFRVKKKIFATMDLQAKQVNLKLSEIDQSVFIAYDDSIIYPVKGAWGKKGWTTVDLEKVPEEMFVDALTTAYCEVAPKKLGDKYRPKF